MKGSESGWFSVAVGGRVHIPEIIKGDLPSGADRMVREWTQRYQREFLEMGPKHLEGLTPPALLIITTGYDERWRRNEESCSERR